MLKKNWQKLAVLIFILFYFLSNWPPIWQASKIFFNVFAEEIEEESEPEETTESIQPPEEASSPPPAPLKQRNFDKEIEISKNPQHACSAKNFRIDISGQSQMVVEFDLKGKRKDSEIMEIGNLPLGVDITFLNNDNYIYQPKKTENKVILKVVNQLGSEKGNFTIPIIYTNDNEITICQLNVINF